MLSTTQPFPELRSDKKDQASTTATEMAEDDYRAALGVHLVGSLPHHAFKTAGDAFKYLFSHLPGRLPRMPDGELDKRWYYVNWQQAMFSEQIKRRGTSVDMQSMNSLAVDEKYEPTYSDVRPLEYDNFAMASYQEFKKARAQATSAYAQHVRFQVSLPLPVEVVAIHVEPCYQERVARLYEQRMAEVLENIQRNIPAQDLAIQWDAAVSVGLIETDRGNLNLPIPFFNPWFSDAKQNILAGASRMLQHINKGVETGFHLCYGDINHEHFMQPQNLGLVVELANELAEIVRNKNDGSRLQWVHMPVPKNRDDDAYFQPLQRLNLDAGAELYLGLVHPGDEAGTEKRISTAKRHYKGPFGVATECGLGRTPKEQLSDIVAVSTNTSTLLP